ncbi:MAG: CapA family protein [Lachnospiraceae bacterium]|nr:CapA family protein [Lachnospiraceae bacterium]
MSRRKKYRPNYKGIFTLVSLVALVTIVVAFVVTGCFDNGEKSTGGIIGDSENSSGTTDVITTEPPTTEEPTEPPTEAPVELTLIAVGDNLIHTGVIKTGKQDDGTYNFDFMFTEIQKYIDAADISVINQETIFGGDDKEFGGYPRFNSPTAIGDSIAKAGFNVVLHASNHARDMGLSGLLNTVEYWKTKPEVLTLGIYETEEEQKEIPIMEVEGIKFAMLNYTYSHNAATFAKDVIGHLNMLCYYDPDTRAIDYNTINPQVIEDIKKAEEIADVVVVFPHWGTEYTLKATKQEKNFAKLMTEAGADLIIGTHPHVIQPVEWIESDNGNKSLCYYSLGNYLSTQDRAVSMLGGMAMVKIKKEDGKITIGSEGTGVIPLVTHYTYKSYAKLEAVYLLSDYTEEMAANHGMMKRYASKLEGNKNRYLVTKEKLDNWAEDVFGDWLLER